MSQQALTNPSVRRSIFSSTTINDAVLAHQVIKGWNFTKPINELSVFDFLCDVTGFTIAPNPAIKAALQSKTRVQWNNFGLNMPQYAQMVSRQKFIRNLAPDDIAELKSPSPDLKALERITYYIHSANILFPFKCWWIVREPGRAWNGVHATTSPVVTTLKKYWKGIYGIDLRENSDFQYALANELELDPIELNTRLWVMGRQ
jgi:hypothetical protein